MRTLAKKSGNIIDLKVRFFKSKSELILRLNQKQYEKKKITNFTVYSHGFPGHLDFGYKKDNENCVAFKLYSTDIGYIKKESFRRPQSVFYSCNTAKEDGKGHNFAKIWQKRFGGYTKAFRAKTDYSEIRKRFEDSGVEFLYRMMHTFPEIMPSFRYPTGEKMIWYYNSNEH